MSAAGKVCHHRTLARNSVAHIQRCDDCGCVAIHLGPVSVRLDEAAAEGLWIVLGEALQNLHASHAAPLGPAFPALRGKA